MYCERRGLYIRPSRDCRYCHWYECDGHPYSVDKITLDIILSGCPTHKKLKKSSRGRTDPVEWDGLRTTCRRWRWWKGNRPDVDPNQACEECTLPRPCDHRGEAGQFYIDRMKEKKNVSEPKLS